MNLFKLFVAVAAIVTLFSMPIGCSSNLASSTSNPAASTQAFQVPSSYTTYTDEAGLFSVSYPSQWEPVDSAEMDAAAKEMINNLKIDLPIEKASIIFAASFNDTTGNLPGFNIVIEPLPSGLSKIDQVASAEMRGLKQVDPKYQEVSRTKTVVNGKDAVLIEYKAYFSSDILSHNLLLIVTSGKTIWTLTCSATDDTFDQWVDDFNNIARSLKITN